jgi:hypothetical protein
LSIATWSRLGIDLVSSICLLINQRCRLAQSTKRVQWDSFLSHSHDKWGTKQELME